MAWLHTRKTGQGDKTRFVVQVSEVEERSLTLEQARAAVLNMSRVVFGFNDAPVEELSDDEYVAADVAIQMAEPAVAEKLLRALDLALHPWGEPGVVPTEVGCWYLQSRDDPESPWGEEQPVVTTGSLPGSLARSPVSVYGIGWSWSALAVDDTQGSVCNRFRRRWTTEGPVTT